MEWSPSRSGEIIVTVIAIALVLGALRLPWYEVTIIPPSDPRWNVAIRMTEYYVDYYEESDGDLMRYPKDSLMHELMKDQMLTIIAWVAVATLFIGLCKTRPSRVHWKSGFAMLFLTVFLLAMFMAEAPAAASEKEFPIELTGFMGSAGFDVGSIWGDEEYIWAPDYGWGVLLLGCLLQSFAVILHVRGKVAAYIIALVPAKIQKS